MRYVATATNFKVESITMNCSKCGWRNGHVFIFNGILSNRWVCGVLMWLLLMLLLLLLFRPIAGHANLCPRSISTKLPELDVLISTVKHEILHALGFSVSLFAFYRDGRGNPLTPRDEHGKPALNEKWASLSFHRLPVAAKTKKKETDPRWPMATAFGAIWCVQFTAAPLVAKSKRRPSSRKRKSSRHSDSPPTIQPDSFRWRTFFAQSNTRRKWNGRPLRKKQSENLFFY